jgi:hypothetical protein
LQLACADAVGGLLQLRVAALHFLQAWFALAHHSATQGFDGLLLATLFDLSSQHRVVALVESLARLASDVERVCSGAACEAAASAATNASDDEMLQAAAAADAFQADHSVLLTYDALCQMLLVLAQCGESGTTRVSVCSDPLRCVPAQCMMEAGAALLSAARLPECISSMSWLDRRPTMLHHSFHYQGLAQQATTLRGEFGASWARLLRYHRALLPTLRLLLSVLAAAPQDHEVRRLSACLIHIHLDCYFRAFFFSSSTLASYD